MTQQKNLPESASFFEYPGLYIGVTLQAI